MSDKKVRKADLIFFLRLDKYYFIYLENVRNEFRYLFSFLFAKYLKILVIRGVNIKNYYYRYRLTK